MMKVPDTTDKWRTSSYSAQETDCVKVRHDLAALRDSKDPAAGTLAVDLRNLVGAVKADRLTR